MRDKNAVNPNGFTSILTMSQRKILVPKSGSSLSALANYEMINESRICVVYYNPNYTPPKRKPSRQSLTDYSPKSGTNIAYDYAVKKGNIVINIF